MPISWSIGSHKMSKNPLWTRACQRKTRGRSWRWVMLTAVGWTHLLGTDILRWRNMLSTLRPASHRSTHTLTHTPTRPADLNLACLVTLSTEPSSQLVAAGVRLWRTWSSLRLFTTTTAISLRMRWHLPWFSEQVLVLLCMLCSHMENVKYVREMQ